MKQAIQTATIIMAGGIGSIMVTMVFHQKDFPRWVSLSVNYVKPYCFITLNQLRFSHLFCIYPDI